MNIPSYANHIGSVRISRVGTTSECRVVPPA